MPKIKLEIEMDVQVMSKEELAACDITGQEADEFIDAGLSEYAPDDIAECIVSTLNHEEAIREGFAGSNIFVTVADAKLISSEIEDI